MAIELYTDWYGGLNGTELLPKNVTTLMVTRIMGELLNNGIYNGPINYKLKYIPRDSDIEVYVDNVLYNSSIVFNNIIHVDGPESGNYIYINYSPLIDSYYFGDNASKLEKGYSLCSKFQPYFITNILYKITEIEYILNIPISKWYDKFIDEKMYVDINIDDEPFIMIKIKQTLNNIIQYLNKTYMLDINYINIREEDKDIRMYNTFIASDISYIRSIINSLQVYVMNIFNG